MVLLLECGILVNLIIFSSQSSTQPLPSEFVFERGTCPTPEAVNKLLSLCKEATYPSRKLELALKKSDAYFSIFEKKTRFLVGFVRVTSDRGLNANLWNLVAIPGDFQEQLLVFLVDQALTILRREMPGCSVSVAASAMTLKALKKNGFLIDPGGIRAMGYSFRKSPFSKWFF